MESKDLKSKLVCFCLQTEELQIAQVFLIVVQLVPKTTTTDREAKKMKTKRIFEKKMRKAAV